MEEHVEPNVLTSVSPLGKRTVSRALFEDSKKRMCVAFRWLCLVVCGLTLTVLSQWR